MGLSNTRARLRSSTVNAQRFSLSEREGGGAEANLVIPFVRAAEERKE